MVVIDTRDHFHRGTPDRGGVEPATQPHLEHRHLHALPREVIEGKRGERFEHRGVEAGDQGAESLDAVGQIGPGGEPAVAPAAPRPAAWRMAASIAETEPLPLVPAIWAKVIARSGLPTASRSASMRSRPGRMPASSPPRSPVMRATASR